ncbi:MAG: MFS transporter [Rubrivivax sp.]|nr:MAG: MFS transporter [Rubrivivax sp.]
MKADQRPHQFRLLGQRRYAPFFATVFLGSVNDNLLKFAITLLLTYQVAVPWLPANMVGPVLGAIFIAPSLLLSATAGQWADRCDLAWLMRLGKSLEITMMVLAAWALWRQDVPMLLVCVALSGAHVTLFSTTKYAYLPQHLGSHELMGGNGLLELGTFTAILLGTLAGGLLVAPEAGGVQALAATVLLLSALGRLASRWIPATPAVDPGLKVNWNPIAETWRNLRRCHDDPLVFAALLGISWMWFFGAVFLALFPVLSKEVLHGGEGVASLLLLLTSAGIGAGALMCEGLSRGRVALGLVPVGALGMAVFGADLAWNVHALDSRAMAASPVLWNAMDFARQPGHWRFLVDLCLMAMSVGLFSVPLYAQMQAGAEPSHRARIIAANNILNAGFILVSAGLVGGLSAAGLGLGAVLGVVAGLHVVVCVLGFWWRPVFVRDSLSLMRLPMGPQS